MVNKISQQVKLPPRNQDAHKGDFGRILIIGGCRAMPGAPAFTANAAFRSGAGLVKMALPEKCQLTTIALAPGATSYVLPCSEDGVIDETQMSKDEISAIFAENDVIVVGPGLSRSPNSFAALFEELLTLRDKPVIIDADGLNCLARLALADLIDDKLADNFILTPHLGEMVRLWQGWFRQDMPADRVRVVEKFARTCGAIVVLKGLGTLISNGEISYINDTGNPGMAVGGSGDILTGVIAGICGYKNSGLTLMESAALGVHVHGKAGDLACAEKTEVSVTPQDIIDFLPAAWKEHFIGEVE